MTDEQAKKLDEVHAMLRSLVMNGSGATPAPGSGKWDGPGGVADAALLDGKYGNPKVFKTEPKEWDGPSQVGVPASEVPTAYGFAYADMMDRFGDKAKREGTLGKNGKPNAWMKFQEAAIFRAWAKRNSENAPPVADLF